VCICVYPVRNLNEMMFQDVGYLDHKQHEESLERKYESAEIRCQRLEEEKAQLKSELEQSKAHVRLIKYI